MKRALDAIGLVGLVLLVAMLGRVMHERQLERPPAPLAIDDPATNEVVLWPG